MQAHEGSYPEGRRTSIHSELDYFIECLKELRRLRREEGYLKAESFQRDMKKYFRLTDDTMSVFVQDQLLRLADTPAGTSSARNDVLLKQIHAMENGDRFTLYGQHCLFRYHTGKRDDRQEGFFEYVYEGDLTMYRTMDYNTAWSLLQQGVMEIDIRRASQA